MGAIWSYFTAPPETPIRGFLPRIINVAVNNHRGLVGFLVPAIVLPFVISKQPHLIVLHMWLMMIWYFLMVPVAPPVTGFIPLFIIPGGGIYNTNTVCTCYFNEIIALMLVGGWLQMALNNSQFDKRFALWVITSGKTTITPMSLVIRSSLAAYVLSMFSNSCLVSKNIISFVAPSLSHLDTGSSKEPSFKKIRYITCSAISSSSAIGGIAILNASVSTLCAAGIWSLSFQGKQHNVFNFLEYSLFAFPTSLVMVVVSLTYYCILMKLLIRKNMTVGSQKTLVDSIKKHHYELIKSKLTCHEIYALFAVFISMALYFTRRNRFFGWANDKYYVRDATVGAIGAIILHIIPKDVSFINTLTSERQSKLRLKVTSGVLYFRFVDMMTYYGYFTVIGSGIALNEAVRVSKLDVETTRYWASRVTEMSWPAASLVVCSVSWLLATLMNGAAAVVLFLPFLINTYFNKMYLMAIAVGMGGSLGFVLPFRATPIYHCRKDGNVPIWAMIKYGLLNSFLCMLILWVALALFADSVFQRIAIVFEEPVAPLPP